MKRTDHPSLWVRESAELLATTDGIPTQTDVVVVGGGVAGISTALHLARAGVAVVVLEAGLVAGRASGRNDGQLLLGLGEHYNRIVGQFGREHARLLWQFIRDNNAALKAELGASVPECDLVDGGGLRLAETEHEHAELVEAADMLRAEAIPHTLLDVSALRARLPVAHGFHGALELPGEAIVQPAAMVGGLARLAIAAGARICEQARVTRLERHASGIDVLLLSGQRVRAPIAVLCTSALGGDLDDTGFLDRVVFPFRGQVIATDPLPERTIAPFGAAAMSSNFCYEYFRAHRNRFVIGGMRWSVKGQEEGTRDDTVCNPDISRNLLAYVAEHFPSLRDVPFPHAWTGIMAGTPDGLPLLGALPGRSDTFVQLAFNGYGLSFAFLGGAVLAEQIVHGRADHPAASLFAPRRLS